MPEKTQPKNNNQTISVNPATGKILGHTPQQSVDDLKQIIEKARVAQEEWVQIPIKIRIQHIKNIGRYIYENADSLAQTISEDNGKTQTDAFASEVFPAVMAVDYYCKNAKHFLKDEKISSSNIFFLHKRSRIVHFPWGVIGIISPWNYPFSIPFYQVVSGLLAGNAVILKIASETQMVGKVLRGCIDAGDLPDGLFAYVNMPGRLIGDALLDNGIDKLFFTGSENVGKKLMIKAAETLTPVSLELGGNDPMIVCENADLQRAVNGTLWAGFQNCGQSCAGIERIYIHENRYNEFINLLKAGVESLRFGTGTDMDIDIGAMTTKGQIDLVESHVKEALQKGAKLYAKSQIPDDKSLQNFIPAMVLTDVNHEMEMMQEESFGPVVGVMKYRTAEEAIRMANDSKYGLSASVWSKDRKKAEKIGRQLQAGVVTINDHLMSHGMSETPWGGFKRSGIGRCHGQIGFDEMTQPQVIVQDLLHFAKKNPWWHPYSKKVYDGLKGIMEYLYGRNFITRSRGLFRFLKLVPGMFSH